MPLVTSNIKDDSSIPIYRTENDKTKYENEIEYLASKTKHINVSQLSNITMITDFVVNDTSKNK